MLPPPPPQEKKKKSTNLETLKPEILTAAEDPEVLQPQCHETLAVPSKPYRTLGYTSLCMVFV